MTATQPHSETHRVHAGGIHLHVQVDGADGPWVVLVHGLAMNHTIWDATARHLAPRYRVLRLDLRGHGASEAPLGPYSMIRLADDVIEVMDALQVPQAHLVGLSLGGMIGQTFAVRHAERLLSATLADTSRHTPLEMHPALYERIGQAEAHGMAGVVHATLLRWLSAPYREAHPEVVEWLRAMVEATPVNGYVGGCQAILAFDLADAIGRIHCPALIVVGDKDAPGMLEEAQAMAAAIPCARLEVFAGAAHLAPLEQLDRFHTALDAFLGKAACGAQCDIP